MTTTLSTRISLNASWKYHDTTETGRTVKDENAIAWDNTWTNGTTDDEADVVFATTQDIASAGTYDLDLAGTVADAFGNTVTFVEVRAVVILHPDAAADGGTVEVGGGSNTFDSWLGATGDVVKIRPTGFLAFGSGADGGYAVTAGTGDILRLTASGAKTDGVRILIVGTTA